MQEIKTFTEKTSKWLTEEAFNNTLFRENFCINLLWIFSQPRIHPKNKKIHQICTNCFNKLSGQSAKILGFSFIQDAITEAEHSLSKILGKLPSIEGCLTPNEKDAIHNQLKSIEISDNCFDFEDSTQYKNLRKLISLTSVSSLLDNYDDLLEKATSSDDSINKRVGAVIQYILMDDDQVKDSVGLLGLVDDIYALETLNSPELLSQIEDLKWESELKSPNFRYPIIVAEDGSNLFNNADNLLKIGILNSSKPENNLRLIKEQNPKTLALLISILSTITDIKIRKQKLNTIDPYELEENETYEIFLRENHTITMIFKRLQIIGDQEFFMFDVAKANKPRNDLNPSNTTISRSAHDLRNKNVRKVDSSTELSNEKDISEFFEAPGANMPGLYPFKSTRNLEYELHKSALICPKNTFNLLTEIEIEGKTVREWFGYKYIKKTGEIEEKKGLLNSESLLIHATDIDNLLDYFGKYPEEMSEIQTVNYVEKKDINFSALNQLTKLNKILGINIYLEIWTKFNSSKAEDLGFKIISHKITDKQNAFPLKDDAISSYLSKIGSLSEISFNISQDEIIYKYKNLISAIETENNEIKNILHGLWVWVDKQNLELKYYDIEDRKEKFHQRLRKLSILQSHAKGVSDLLLFAENNEDSILRYNKFNLISQWLEDNNQDCYVLLTQKDCKKLKSIDHKISDNVIDTHQLESNVIGNIRKLLIPSILDKKTIEIIIKSNHAKEIEIICDQTQKDNIKTRVDCFRGIQAEQQSASNDDNLMQSVEEIFKDFNPATLKNDYSREIHGTYDHFRDATALHLEEGGVYFLPENGDIISSPLPNDLQNNLTEVQVSDLEAGDYVMLPDTHGGSLSDYILDKIRPNMNELRTSAYRWKKILKEYIETKELKIDEMADFLGAEAGLKRDPSTIKQWIANDHLIAPQNPEESIPALFKAFSNGRDYIEDAQTCIKSCKEIYSLRRQVLNNLLTILKNPILKDGKITFSYEEEVFEFNFVEINYIQKDVQINQKDLYHIVND